MLSLDAVTLAAYAASATDAAKAQAVVDGLSGTISVKVYDAGGVVGTGTMVAPWATASASTITIGELASFSVTQSGTPDPATWYLRLEDASGHYLQGTFGLTGSGADFRWSAATWTTGQTGSIGTGIVTVNGGGVIFEWTSAAGYAIELYTTGGTYDLSQHLAIPPGITPTYALTTPFTGVSVNASTGLLTVVNGTAINLYALTVTADNNVVAGAGAVTNLTVAQNLYSLVELTWTAAANATSYGVERSTDGTTWTTFSTASTSYIDSTVAAATAYQYRVRGLAAAGNGTYSTISTTTPAAPVLTPGQVTGLGVTGVGSNFVSLSWLAPVNALTYSIERSIGGVGWAVVGTSAGLAFTDPSASASTTYQYRVRAYNLVTPGAYSATVNATTSAIPTSADWTARSTEAGVVWAHRFESLSEITKHYVANANGDRGAATVPGISPDCVVPHLFTDGIPCLEITQLGGQLAGILDSAPLTQHVLPAAVLTVTGTRFATLSLPLSAADWGIADNLSTFYIATGDNAGIYMAANSVPVVSATAVTVNVLTSDRTPFVGSQTGMEIQHCLAESLSNPYQDVLIDEFVDEVGGQTWASPTGFNLLTVDANGDPVVPADAYSVVLHRTTAPPSGFTADSKYKDKVTVVKKVYHGDAGGPADPLYRKTTLTIRRAVMGPGEAGRLEKDIVNQLFPCGFQIGTLIGRDVKGGWGRTMAALRAVENGLTKDDLAVNNTVRRRQRYRNNGTVAPTFRTGYYGHEDYHDQYTDAAPFTPNTITAANSYNGLPNGGFPFNGNEFYLAWTIKYSPLMTNRTGSTKLYFIDQYQNPDDSQIVGSSITGEERNFRWFHNYGSNQNSKLTGPDGSYNPSSILWNDTCLQGQQDVLGNCWWPPLGEWFAMRVHIRAGHENCMLYNNVANVVTEASISGNTMTIKSGLIPLAPGLVLPTGLNAGRYPVSLDNPLALDPQRSGYFASVGGSGDKQKNWKLSFRAAGRGGGILADKDYKILTHTVAGSETIFIVEKLNDTSPWPPPGSPSPGDTFNLEWKSKEESARYVDTLIEFHKKEASDSDWVLVASLYHPITFNGGASDAAAGNPRGWSQFQPTGYANIDDNSAPGSRTIYTRFAEIILSHSPIAAPTL